MTLLNLHLPIAGTKMYWPVVGSLTNCNPTGGRGICIGSTETNRRTNSNWLFSASTFDHSPQVTYWGIAMNQSWRGLIVGAPKEICCCPAAASSPQTSNQCAGNRACPSSCPGPILLWSSALDPDEDAVAPRQFQLEFGWSLFFGI